MNTRFSSAASFTPPALAIAWVSESVFWSVLISPGWLTAPATNTRIGLEDFTTTAICGSISWCL